MSEKAISLPVNTLVILAVAVIVLVALVGFFMGSYTPAGETTKQQSKFRSLCTQEVITRGCCSEDLSNNIPSRCEIGDGSDLDEAAESVGVGTSDPDDADIIRACCNIEG